MGVKKKRRGGYKREEEERKKESKKPSCLTWGFDSLEERQVKDEVSDEAADDEAGLGRSEVVYPVALVHL